jgi:hypothetical protein
MTLINLVGWFAATIDKPVSYKTRYFQTIQETMVKESIQVWVYDSVNKKICKITLTMPSTERDSVKTKRACFPHQKDA